MHSREQQNKDARRDGTTSERLVAAKHIYRAAHPVSAKHLCRAAHPIAGRLALADAELLRTVEIVLPSPVAARDAVVPCHASADLQWRSLGGRVCPLWKRPLRR